MARFTWHIAADLPARLVELRRVLGDSTAEFTARFGRGENQFYQWQKGAQLPPQRVLEETAKRENWPRGIFEEGGITLKDLARSLVNARPKAGVMVVGEARYPTLYGAPARGRRSTRWTFQHCHRTTILTLAAFEVNDTLGRGARYGTEASPLVA